MIRLLPILLLLSGCVAVSTEVTEKEDIVTGEMYYGISFTATYPKEQFMTAEEWVDFQSLPNHQREVMYKYYKEREETEENWETAIKNIMDKLWDILD